MNPTPELSALAERWGVILERPLLGSTCSEVWAGTRDARPVALKLPRADAEEARSLATLRAFSEVGGVSVLDSDDPTGACLLPLLGGTLDRFGLGDEENTRIFARAALRLRRAEKVEAPTFEQFASDAFDSEAEVLLQPLRMIRDLLDSRSLTTLTHGDLHHANLLKEGAGYVAIDPKGIWTDPTYEIVAYVRNPDLSRLTSAEVRRRIEIVADEWGETYERLWTWSWAGNMISSWWNDPNTDGRALAAIVEAR